MSKSKSRQSSKATSGARQGSAANRTTVKAGTNSATEEKQATANELSAAKVATKAASSTPTAGKAQTRDAAKYERRQAERQMRYLAEKRARRNKRIAWTSGILALLIIGSVAAYFIYQSRLPAKANGTTPFTPYEEPVFNSTYPPVDNVYCDQQEQVAEHNHVLLTIYIDGQQYPLPANTGIVTDQQGNATCFYWLHVHAQYPNIIHIEAPTTEPFTLGQFIAEWDQQFNSLGFPSQLLLTKGWTIWVNGHPYTGHLNDVTLNAHDMITIAYNSPNAKPVTTYNWSGL